MYELSLFVLGVLYFAFASIDCIKINFRYLPFNPDELLNVHGHHVPFVCGNHIEGTSTTPILNAQTPISALLPFRINWASIDPMDRVSISRPTTTKVLTRPLKDRKNIEVYRQFHRTGQGPP